MSGSREIGVFPRVQVFNQSHFFWLTIDPLHKWHLDLNKNT